MFLFLLSLPKEAEAERKDSSLPGEHGICLSPQYDIPVPFYAFFFSRNAEGEIEEKGKESALRYRHTAVGAEGLVLWKSRKELPPLP